MSIARSWNCRMRCAQAQRRSPAMCLICLRKALRPFRPPSPKKAVLASASSGVRATGLPTAPFRSIWYLPCRLCRTSDSFHCKADRRKARRDHSAPHVSCERLTHTASLLYHLDLVISVDTMMAHLAGALGVSVWTLLHADCDWRWMDQRSKTLWYPTMRLFRQHRRGDWAAVLDAVRVALSRRFESRADSDVRRNSAESAK